MAIEYRLALAAGAPAEQVAARAFPDPVLFQRDGFHTFVTAGRHGYFAAASDDGEWLWEPPAYVTVDFRLDKFADRERVVTTMVTAVHRVLATGPEDAAFTFNGDILLFTRNDGRLVKHRRGTWWAHHPSAADLIRE